MLKVALVHDWLTGMRGGESVLEGIAEIFPHAEIYTLIHTPESISARLNARTIHTSFLQKIPGAQKRYRHFLPLMPKAIEAFNVRQADLIISSSHCVAKGVQKRSDAVHVSYVHAPMRYMWFAFEDYFSKDRSSFVTRKVAETIRPYLQDWDRSVSSADRVDHLIANSQFIAGKIKEAYGRDASVIHPFVNLDRFQQKREAEDFYLMVGAFAPNKKVDLAIQAFNQLKKKLVIVGGGPDEEQMMDLAGETIEFRGRLSNSEIDSLYARCKAFILPGTEDFGITTLEAMASGAPVIAFNGGGYQETVTSQTGILFSPQTPEGLVGAVKEFEDRETPFSSFACRTQAEKFSKSRFQKELINTVYEVWESRGKDPEVLETGMFLPSGL